VTSARTCEPGVKHGCALQVILTSGKDVIPRFDKISREKVSTTVCTRAEVDSSVGLVMYARAT